jgi:catechol 2,3-dioxygenase-like lactoylglutathione lyase family enzyme
MAVKSIDHVQLAMPPGGEAEARRFYDNLLGIPEVPKPADMAARGGCWFEQGSLKVHLGVEQGFRASRKAHPAFIVDDLRALATRLEQGGCHPTEGGSFDGHLRYYVDDPFGNRIELIEPLAETGEA